MAPKYSFFDNNPIHLETRKALRVIGGLIEKWTLDPQSRPANARQELDGRLIVFSTADFWQLLSDLPEPDRLTDEDIRLREGITEIELFLRRPDRFSVLLPEPEALEFQIDALEKTFWPVITMPWIYTSVQWTPDANWIMDAITPPSDTDEKGSYALALKSEDALDAFLRPYLAGYCCTQCS